MRLDEHDRAFGIEACRVQSDGHVDGPLGEGRGVVGLRDGVQVHDREQAIMLVLQLDPVLDGAEVVADVQLARGLDAGKDACHGVTTYDCGARPRKVRELKDRSEEHTSELQSRLHLVCRLLLEKKKKQKTRNETGRPATN